MKRISRSYEFILLILILFQILDFFKLLTPFWDYVKKIISWVLIAYLLYLVSPSDILFGERRKWWDASFIIASLAMVLKTALSFAVVARKTMIDSLFKYVHFVPATVSKGLFAISVNQPTLNAFSTLGVTPVNATNYAVPFATQITVTNQTLPFTFTSGNATVGAILEPFGLNGLTLQFYNTLANNLQSIEKFFFVFGSAVLLLLAIYGAFRFKVKKKSVLSVLHEEGEKTPLQEAIKLLITIVAVSAFFVLIFNLASEWLAIAIDAPIAMSGIAFYLFLLLRSHRLKHKSVGEDDLLQRMGTFGNNFFKKGVQLFQQRGTILLGLSGLLVLHLLTDIGTFVLPYITGLQDQLYFGQLGAGHKPIIYHILASWTALPLGDALATTMLYVLNVVAILVLLSLPAYIWYKTFKIRTRSPDESEEQHHPHLSYWFIALSLSAIITFVLKPAFLLRKLGGKLVGVDLQTTTISTQHPQLLLAVITVIFFILLLLGLRERIKNYLMALLFIAVTFFFGAYTLLYFLGSVEYYFNETFGLLFSHSPIDLFIGGWILLFFIINMFFYIFSFCSFIYELRD